MTWNGMEPWLDVLLVVEENWALCTKEQATRCAAEDVNVRRGSGVKVQVTRLSSAVVDVGLWSSRLVPPAVHGKEERAGLQWLLSLLGGSSGHGMWGLLEQGKMRQPMGKEGDCGAAEIAREKEVMMMCFIRVLAVCPRPRIESLRLLVFGSRGRNWIGGHGGRFSLVLDFDS